MGSNSYFVIRLLYFVIAHQPNQPNPTQSTQPNPPKPIQQFKQKGDMDEELAECLRLSSDIH